MHKHSGGSLFNYEYTLQLSSPEVSKGGGGGWGTEAAVGVHNYTISISKRGCKVSNVCVWVYGGGGGGGGGGARLAPPPSPKSNPAFTRLAFSVVRARSLGLSLLQEQTINKERFILCYLITE